MKYPKIPLAQTIVQLCKLKKIQHIVISPGSRNAPLILGFTNDSYFKCYSIVDERCAAFFAMGLAQQLKHPVAVVCTSGSALLNYYPAVAEAFYSDIPLVVVSADRPKYLVGIGDGQTINQPDVYKNHILYSASLKQDIDVEKGINEDEEEELPIIKSIENKLERFLGLKQNIQEFNEGEINSALNYAIVKNGPVHINCPFNEPLYETQTTLSVSPKGSNPILEHGSETYNYTEFANIWNTSKRKLVLIGVNFPDTLNKEILDFLAEDKSVVVMTETTSNVFHEKFIPSIDKLIMPSSTSELNNLQPDILITLGGMVVSKKIKKFLRAQKPKHHWHIDAKKANDTFFVLSQFFKQSFNTFFEEMQSLLKPIESDYQSYWLHIFQLRKEKHNEYLKIVPYSDFKVFNLLLKRIPNYTHLQVSNSSTIRYTQLFGINPTLKLFCNRGTSGIDGGTSTAIGAAVAEKQQTTFITGDLSFFYDSNALWNKYIPNNFRIIIINNNGGGIFRILPGEKNTEIFDNYFETVHNLNASQLCDMYGFKYFKSESIKELGQVLDEFYEEGESPRLLEVFTPRTVNDSVLLDYFDYLK